MHKNLQIQHNNYSLVFLMNNITYSHFYFLINLRIIRPVDEGHHLNVL
jgi:hypothetical protein